MNDVDPSTAAATDTDIGPLLTLLGGADAVDRHVGYVYLSDYDRALVMTNDFWKHRVGGMPANSFLVAAGFDPASSAPIDSADQEVLLLRVMTPTRLPDTDTDAVLIDRHRRRLQDEVFPDHGGDGLDPLTRADAQFGAVECEILGTFYVDQDLRELTFGADVETVESCSRLRVYAPTGAALSMIVNHVNPNVRAAMRRDAAKAGFDAPPAPVEIGRVRYSSTRRRRRDTTGVPVTIQPSDFLGRRTAIYGMTRTGKSNTVKTILSSIALAGLGGGVRIGQLIFDVNGEYANANHQDDGSSIAEVFGDDCVRYRAVSTEGFEDLRINFYEEPGEAIALIADLLARDRSLPQDVKNFLDAEFVEPPAEEHEERRRYEIRVALFRAILWRAGLRADRPISVWFRTREDLRQAVADAGGPEFHDMGHQGRGRLTVAEAADWFCTAGAREDIMAWLAGAKDPVIDAAFGVLTCKSAAGNVHRGYKVLIPFRAYHSPRPQSDVLNRIYQRLASGKIVIVDLSIGPVGIRTALAERIARYVFETSMAAMNRNEVPPNIVVYTEESHNLIGRTEELTSTWPRLAKEGAKAKISFCYATQEPSSIHPNIMANTENWICTHLNNDDELRVLGRYYDFERFAEQLKRGAQDVGFARVRTLSLAYTVPVQINRFDPAAVAADRQRLSAARHRQETRSALGGLDALVGDGGGAGRLPF